MKRQILLYILTLGMVINSYTQNYGWTDISSNLPTNADLSDVFFINDSTGWITSSSHAEIYHTTDGGNTYVVQTTLYTCNAIHMLNEDLGYAGGASGFVYKTTDGGGNWNFHGTTVSTLADIHFPPIGDIGYCCGINGNLWSIDSSDVTEMISGVPDNLYSISFPISSEEGWVCGGSIIRHFINEEWTAADQDYPSGGYNAIYMVDSLNGWTVGDGGIIAHTSDGKNWFEQTNPDPQLHTFYNTYFLNTSEGWAVGLSGTLIHTINGGDNWNIAAADFTSKQLNAVHFNSPTNGYVVGNGKTLLKYTDILGIGDNKKIIDFEIFPNPTKNKIQIKCSEFKTESGTVEILSIDGKEILKKEIGQGNENSEINVGHLETGLYLCKISTDTKSSTKKLMIE